MCAPFFMHGRGPSHSYYVETDRFWFSPTRQTVLARRGKRGRGREGRTLNHVRAFDFFKKQRRVGRHGLDLHAECFGATFWVAFILTPRRPKMTLLYCKRVLYDQQQ